MNYDLFGGPGNDSGSFEMEFIFETLKCKGVGFSYKNSKLLNLNWKKNANNSIQVKLTVQPPWDHAKFSENEVGQPAQCVFALVDWVASRKRSKFASLPTLQLLTATEVFLVVNPQEGEPQGQFNFNRIMTDMGRLYGSRVLVMANEWCIAFVNESVGKHQSIWLY